VRARPLTVTVAIVLLALLSLSNLLAPVISEGIPRAAVYLLIVVGALGLVSALGLWMLKGWRDHDQDNDTPGVQATLVQERPGTDLAG
jgi:hypothetical protein